MNFLQYIYNTLLKNLCFIFKYLDNCVNLFSLSLCSFHFLVIWFYLLTCLVVFIIIIIIESLLCVKKCIVLKILSLSTKNSFIFQSTDGIFALLH